MGGKEGGRGVRDREQNQRGSIYKVLFILTKLLNIIDRVPKIKM